MKYLSSVLDLVNTKIREIKNIESYDSEPGFTERGYIRSLEEIKNVITYEMSKKNAEKEVVNQ